MKYSIYDTFTTKPDWVYGVLSPYGRESDLKTKMQYQFCSKSGSTTLTHTRKNVFQGEDIVLRGSILGYNKNNIADNISWHPLEKEK